MGNCTVVGFGESMAIKVACSTLFSGPASCQYKALDSSDLESPGVLRYSSHSAPYLNKFGSEIAKGTTHCPPSIKARAVSN